jgi:hypothetical protein
MPARAAYLPGVSCGHWAEAAERDAAGSSARHPPTCPLPARPRSGSRPGRAGSSGALPSDRDPRPATPLRWPGRLLGMVVRAVGRASGRADRVSPTPTTTTPRASVAHSHRTRVHCFVDACAGPAACSQGGRAGRGSAARRRLRPGRCRGSTRAGSCLTLVRVGWQTQVGEASVQLVAHLRADRSGRLAAPMGSPAASWARVGNLSGPKMKNPAKLMTSRWPSSGSRTRPLGCGP